MLNAWYLDDVRPVPDGMLLLRSYTEFIEALSDCTRLPKLISFDHDLGTEKSGYDCAYLLVEYCLKRDLDLPEVRVHSANLVGAKAILDLINNFERLKVIYGTL